MTNFGDNYKIEKAKSIDYVFNDKRKKYHPDLNPGNKDSEAKFKEVNEAYSMIGTKEAREKFDKGETMNEDFYKDAFRSRSGPFYREYQDGGGRYTQYYQGDADDLFGSFFEGFGQRGGGFNIHGQDQVYKMEVDLQDAVHGAEREIMMPDGKRLKVKVKATLYLSSILFTLHPEKQENSCKFITTKTPTFLSSKLKK